MSKKELLDKAYERFTEESFESQNITKIAEKVAKKYGVKEAGILSRYYSKNNLERGNQRRKILTEYEEKFLLITLKSMDVSHMPLSNKAIQYIIKEILKKEISIRSVQRWVKSHKDILKYQKSNELSKKRKAENITEEVELFYHELEKAHAKKLFLKKNVLNFDEALNSSTSGDQNVITSKGSNNSNAV